MYLTHLLSYIHVVNNINMRKCEENIIFTHGVYISVDTSPVPVSVDGPAVEVCLADVEILARTLDTLQQQLVVDVHLADRDSTSPRSTTSPS